ncbi:unnamed protein product, partial [Meganyctiphanes norvegica]
DTVMVGGQYCLLIFTTLVYVKYAFSSSSLYDYYVPDGQLTSGLVAEGDRFTLNGKDLLILSGAFHYFRVHPDYWRVTLKKIRAAGFNTVETYVPWNLHEPRQGVYDFGDLDEDMSFLLDIRTFIQTAQEEDLFVILRPGPYICSEWDFGGLPSWLLRDYTMQVRTYYEGYRTAVTAYFDVLLPKVVDLQFMNGGPIIMVQIENEYGAFGYDDFPRDTLYLEFLKDNLISNGMGLSTFFTSDGVLGTQDLGSLPGVLMTANFQDLVSANLAKLKELQPDRPLMVMEFWTGWFDHWLQGGHSTWDVETFGNHLENILQHNASVNMYMFIGGTNWGFMAGANADNLNSPHYSADTQSYDYDCLLTESGDYTAKYDLAKEIIAKYNPLEGIVSNPTAPSENPKSPNSVVNITYSMDFITLLNNVPDVIGPSTDLLSMENLPINDNNGQSYGYIVYTTTAGLSNGNSTLKIKGHVRGTSSTQLFASIKIKAFGKPDICKQYEGRDAELTLNGGSAPVSLKIMVENLGRVNYGKPHNFKQIKGIVEGPVLIDDVELGEWLITPLEFKKSFISSIDSEWGNFDGSHPTPGLYLATVVLDPSSDTYLDMSAWNKGVVFINGFNLGRYWTEGPQQTLYLPAPLIINGGLTEIIIFEQYEAASEVTFIDHPIYYR